jgi:hypothetical protein
MLNLTKDKKATSHTLPTPATTHDCMRLNTLLVPTASQPTAWVLSIYC